MARTNDSKIDHVELLNAYNISLSYCTVHIVRWNIMWNVYFFLMASRTLTVSDFQAEWKARLSSLDCVLRVARRLYLGASQLYIYSS